MRKQNGNSNDAPASQRRRGRLVVSVGATCARWRICASYRSRPSGERGIELQSAAITNSPARPRTSGRCVSRTPIRKDRHQGIPTWNDARSFVTLRVSETFESRVQRGAASSCRILPAYFRTSPNALSLIPFRPRLLPCGRPAPHLRRGGRSRLPRSGLQYGVLSQGG